MKFKDELIGPRIMDTITNGLYDGNLNCLREYVQNSVDGGAVNINIDLENGGHTIQIKDDGEGMDASMLEEALGVGVSRKSGKQVGFRGVGIWSGAAVCTTIVIITKIEGGSKLRIEVDCDKIRKKQFDRTKPTTLLQILSEATGEIERLNDGDLPDSHYTIIRLEEVIDTQRPFFRPDEIKKYLNGNIPAPFHPDFEWSKEIDEYLASAGVNVEYPTVCLDGDRIFRYPNKKGLFRDGIVRKDFLIGEKKIAVGWFLTSKLNAKLREPNVGIFFKKKGFTIGDSQLIVKQYGKTYNPWQYGEIHILSDEVVENSARNNFEFSSSVVPSMLKAVAEYIGKLQGVNQAFSGSDKTKDVEKIQKMIDAGKPREARRELKKMEEKLAAAPIGRVPKDDEFSGMKLLVEERKDASEKAIDLLKERLNEEDERTVDESVKQLRGILSANAHPDLKQQLSKTTSKGIKDPNIAWTDCLESIINKRTGVQQSKFVDLTRAVFGWENVNPGNRTPILAFPGDEKDKYRRTAKFGVAVYSLHDLLVNVDKHQKGDEIFEWFNKLSEKEKELFSLECMITMDVLCKLIDVTKPCRIPGSLNP